VARTAAVTTILVAAGIGTGSHLLRGRESARPVIQLADGSRAVPLDRQSEIVVVQDALDITLRLLRGGGRFEVAPSQGRTFRVLVDTVTIEALGTAFDVIRDPDRVGVTVRRGRVAVRKGRREQVLTAGESTRVRLAIETTAAETSTDRAEAASEEVAPDVAEAADDAGSETLDAAAGGRSQSRWRALAQNGRYEEAYQALRRSGPIRDRPRELMEAADAARLSGHPQQATRYLEQVVRRHPRDPVAPLASFTLGRLYLDTLGKPRRAAKFFLAVQELASTGFLAEDALAREVEAWSKAGDSMRARQRAELYLERYPNGQRRRAVRLFGGLE
jgi:transmembrane sensor